MSSWRRPGPAAAQRERLQQATASQFDTAETPEEDVTSGDAVEQDVDAAPDAAAEAAAHLLEKASTEAAMALDDPTFAPPSHAAPEQPSGRRTPFVPPDPDPEPESEFEPVAPPVSRQRERQTRNRDEAVASGAVTEPSRSRSPQPESQPSVPAPRAPEARSRNHREPQESPVVTPQADVPEPSVETVAETMAAPEQTPPRPTRERQAAVPKEEPAVPDDKADSQDPLGSDGVRDIWARLQAMDDAPRHKHRTEAQKKQEEDDLDEEETEIITDPIPWERQDAYGFWPGLFLTLKKILLQPSAFFESMPDGRPKGKALVFNLLISEFLLVIDFLWSLSGLRMQLGKSGNAEAMGVGAVAGSTSLGFLLALLLVPLILSVGIYLDAWFTHLLLRLFRSSEKGFNETFRVLCYSAAPTVLSAVPVAGQILSPVILIWYMALQAIGLKKIHQGAYTQTLAAIFIKWSVYLFLLLATLQSFTPDR